MVVLMVMTWPVAEVEAQDGYHEVARDPWSELHKAVRIAVKLRRCGFVNPW
jgi:hypothetical protein